MPRDAPPETLTPSTYNSTSQTDVPEFCILPFKLIITRWLPSNVIVVDAHLGLLVPITTKLVELVEKCTVEVTTIETSFGI
jgi:hypothetical protein